MEADNFSTNGITRVGTGAGDSNTGDLITVLGKDAGSSNSGRQLVGFGYEAGKSNSGDFVTTVGYKAGASNTGPYQSSLGYSAGRNNSGNNLSSLGYTAGFGNSGNNSTLIGWQVGRGNSGDNLVAIGYEAGFNNTLDNQFIVRNSTANSIPLIQGNFESGSIGIGLILPQSNLHVAGDIWASGSNGHITASGNISASGTIIANSLTASGLIYPSTDGTDGQAIITDGAGNLSFATSTIEKLHLQVRNDDDVDIPAGTPVYSTGEVGGSERIKVKIASGSDASKMPAIGITETTLTTTGGTKDGFAIINGIYNTNVTPVSGTPVLGSNVYVHANGGLTTIKPSGSTLIQNIGIILKTNGTIIQGMKVSSIDRTNDVPNLLENQIFFGSGSNQSQQIHISGALDQTIINNITASGNISASGNIIATEVTASKITSGDGSLILGYAGSNNITIEDGADFFINAPDGTIEIENGDGAKIEVSDVIALDNVDGVRAIEIDQGQISLGLPANQLISKTFLSSSNVITTDVTASEIIGDNTSLTLGYAGGNRIILENGGDFFIDSSIGTLEIYGSGADLYISDDITLNGNVIATSNITASGNISSSATIIANAFVGGGSGITGVVSASYALTASHALNAGGGGISAVVDDTSPQLGGNLDLNSQDITGTGNISINTTSTLTPSIELISTEDSSDASPIIDLKRNSSSPSNGDYLGQIKFKGENDANQEVVYAKITGKISDVTDTTEDGLIEFATKRAGANVINARLTSTDLKLINSTGLEVDGNISASGDISAITGSFDYITGQVSTITWTVDFTDGELDTTLYAPYNLSINSITNIYNSPTTAISSSGSPYTLGNAITTGEPIDITVSTGSVINLNITR